MKIENTDKVKYLFEGWNETLIWSCLQKTMGEIYADDGENPVSAMAILGDFCFFAGKENEKLVMNIKKDFIIAVPQNEKWATLIEKCYDSRAKRVTRYAIKKEYDIFDKEKLEKVVDGLSDEYSIKIIDEEIYNQCKESKWCADLVSQYTDYEMYKKYGLGVAVLKGGRIISGASSYSHYNDGIEIEIDTKKEYRRQGLAYVCGAKLIIECLKRGLYPSWDAQNKWSVALAEKLGYHYESEYTAYEIVKDL